MSALSSDVVMAIQNANLFQDLNEQLLKNKNLFLQTVFALSSAIEAKDQYMQGHTERVTRYALVIAHNLMRSNQVIVDNLKVIDKVTDADIKKFLENLRISAMLHDIGKIGIPEAILNKKLELNDLEREEIKKHTYIGAKILSEVNEFYEPVLGVKHHHERYDGTGYPEGLAGEKIPFIARIISVADAYDAMTTDRPYRVALTKEKALLIIEAGKSKQFDASIVDAFLLAYKKGEI